MKSLAILALTSLCPFASASPTSPSRASSFTTRQDNGTSSAPCAQVSQYMYGDGTIVVQTQIPAGLAFACLDSVPFNASSGKNLIASIRPYIGWQSTLTQLKNPPPEYSEKVQPAVDIMGGLDQISSDIDAGHFNTEYDFGWELYTLIQSAHDGHFSYIPDIVARIFSWGRPVPLVSVSEDGEQLPAVFAFIDVIGSQYKNISYTPSPVVEIDGTHVFDWLESWSQLGSLQDRDALYNNVYYSLAQVSLGYLGTGTGTFTGGGRGRFVYPGDTTTLKFANGSEYTMQNYAQANINLRNISTGEDLAKEWLNYYGSTASAKVQSFDTDKNELISIANPNFALLTTPGYPAPIVSGPPGNVNGFFIDAPGYEDVAVLSVPSFVTSASYEVQFQQTTRDFIPKALAAGKTKLIIDVQANGGGTILQGYDMFKQLFPNEDPYGANRFRATETVNLIGKTYSSVAAHGPRGDMNYTIARAQSTWFDYHTDMTVDGKPFTSWSDKFGPHNVNGDKYTTPARWNLSDVLIPYFSGGINITGYGELANFTGPAKFRPENIVIVTDGYCASTCAIFAELMTQQMGVKTIAMGGRSNKNPIQAIGGVKGVNNYSFSYLQNLAQNAVQWVPSLANSTLKQDYYNYLPILRSDNPGVNVRDGLRRNDTSGIALQFIYEEANCRLYYTPAMTVDITALWKAAADAQWRNSGQCVSGGNYSQKRKAAEVTSKLGGARMHTAQAAAMKQVQALEDSFSLETVCHVKADGFMQP
ncbi:hypothetical protein ACEQ8H_005039 [Pleosporales sp. CAS-2024a]